MTSDDIELLAYVDGSLSTREREAVERRLARSPDAASRVERIRASKLPYAEAFAQQQLPPVPPSLERMVEGIARASSRDNQRRPLTRIASGWLAVAFCAGMLICAALLSVNDDAPASWVEAAARYQQLYSRETLAHVDADGAVSKATVASIDQDDDIPVRIPDLGAYGLTFKRIQRLRFDGHALIQLVYLPERGDPVALCIMRETRPDAAPTGRIVASMDVVTWRRSELGYALISAQDASLNALARHISDGDAPILFGFSNAPNERLKLASLS